MPSKAKGPLKNLSIADIENVLGKDAAQALVKGVLRDREQKRVAATMKWWRVEYTTVVQRIVLVEAPTPVAAMDRAGLRPVPDAPGWTVLREEPTDVFSAIKEKTGAEAPVLSPASPDQKSATSLPE